MRILIIGAGEVGYHIASRLSQEQHDIVLVDHDDEVVERSQEELDVMTVQGQGSRPATLERAGIADMDMLLAVTNSDEVNLVACLLARQYAVPMCVARINDPDLHDSPLMEAGKCIGIDLMINPGYTVAEEICRLIHTPGAEEAADFLEGRVKLFSFRVSAFAPIIRQRVHDVGARFPGAPPAVIAAIRRGQDTIIPNGDTLIEPDDHLLLIGKNGEIQANLHLLGVSKRQSRRIMIIGGGQVGFHVAHALEQEKARYDIKLIEHEAQRCKLLADRLSRVLVLRGDATDIKELKEEGIADMDTVTAVTNDEDTNLIAALLAKTHGAKEVITLIKRPDLVPLVATLGIDAAISPRLITANVILRHLRRGQVQSMFTSLSTEAETLEMIAMPGAKIIGEPLSKVKMPLSMIIGAVARGEEVIVPRGDTVIQAHDRVIVFALPKVVHQATKLFAGSGRD
ncbi:Trk system potassium uptake protein TrkA [Candidatus Entotheonellaceae bacterium PAL068K]